MSDAGETLSALSAWVSLTRGEEISLGMSTEEAFRRASALRDSIRAGLEPTLATPVDDDAKDVLHGLVALLCSSDSSATELLFESASVELLLQRVDWPDCGFGERAQLIARCRQLSLGAADACCWSIGKETEALSSGAQRPHPFFYLVDRSDKSPLRFAGVAERLFDLIQTWIAPSEEKEQLLGDLATAAANANRHLGEWARARAWLGTAEDRLHRASSADRRLAKWAYVELALKYDRRQHADVLVELPRLMQRFVALGMRREILIARFLGIMTVKASGHWDRAYEELEGLISEPDLSNDRRLAAQVKIEKGAILAWRGSVDEALNEYRQALRLLEEAEQPLFTAHLKATIGETLVSFGREDGLEAYREAIADYEALGMGGQIVYLRLIRAEGLIQFGRPREAELEMLAALPTIEEQKMVPEGFAAVALLEESVRRRKTDPKALRELREHLQANQ